MFCRSSSGMLFGNTQIWRTGGSCTKIMRVLILQYWCKNTSKISILKCHLIHCTRQNSPNAIFGCFQPSRIGLLMERSFYAPDVHQSEFLTSRDSWAAFGALTGARVSIWRCWQETELPSTLRNFITAPCSHFLDVPTCYVAMVILLLNREYTCAEAGHALNKAASACRITPQCDLPWNENCEHVTRGVVCSQLIQLVRHSLNQCSLWWTNSGSGCAAHEANEAVCMRQNWPYTLAHRGVLRLLRSTHSLLRCNCIPDITCAIRAFHTWNLVY